MDKITKVMEEYFKTVTDEQFEKDLIEAGILNCPDKEDDNIVICCKNCKYNYKGFKMPLPKPCYDCNDYKEFKSIEINK